MTVPQFHDAYVGQRWRYGLTKLPPAWGVIPEGRLLNSERDDPSYEHGTVDYPRALDAPEAEAAGLVLDGRFQGPEGRDPVPSQQGDPS